MTLTVYLVGCSSGKLAFAATEPHEAPARDLYTGLVFSASRDYVEALGAEWAILSAKHGLVLPDQVLAPYDFTFRGAGYRKVDRDRWASGVRRDLDARWPCGTKFVLLAGKDYRPWTGGSPSLRLEEPLEGLGIGQRVAWLNKAIKEARAAKEPKTKPKTKAPAPACDKECGAVWHMTGGHHKTNCAAYASHEAALAAWDEQDVEVAPCDFCGEAVPCAISILGSQRFEGDHTPARICERCALWALRQIREKGATTT